MEYRRILTILTRTLGGLWLVDGILQLQPAMFTVAFVDNVLAPNLQGQPDFIKGIVSSGIASFSSHIIWFNLGAALIQILIGALLISAPQNDRLRRFGLWLSVAWALIVWIFGEGFGILATGSATFYTGAPGAALLYLILALFLLSAPKRPSLLKKMPLAAGIIFLAGAALNLAPMFFESGMLSMLSGIPAVSGWLGAIGPQGTLIGNLIAVNILFFLGIFLLLIPGKPIAWTAVVFLAATWWIGQDFGGILTFPFGTATDIGSAPLLMIFLLPVLAIPGHAHK